MKYYKVKIQSIFPDEDRVLGHANGEFVPNGKEYFDKIGNGEILDNTPLFDYFHLQSFGEEKDWEWKLQDGHRFIGVGSVMGGWYISDDLKLLLENFKIAPKYHFYETRLLYKGKKIKYWIFQFTASYRKLNKMEYIDFSRSIFYANEQFHHCDSFDKWSDINEYIYDKYDIELILKKIYINQLFDFIPLNPISSDIICSENLRNVIETMGLTGFEFSEIEYEVKVQK